MELPSRPNSNVTASHALTPSSNLLPPHVQPNLRTPPGARRRGLFLQAANIADLGRLCKGKIEDMRTRAGKNAHVRPEIDHARPRYNAKS